MECEDFGLMFFWSRLNRLPTLRRWLGGEGGFKLIRVVKNHRAHRPCR